jgi:hypothetical protein
MQWEPEDFLVCWQASETPARAAALLAGIVKRPVSLDEVLHEWHRFRSAGVQLKDVRDREAYALIPNVSDSVRTLLVAMERSN